MSQDAPENQVYTARPMQAEKIVGPQPPVLWPRVTTRGLVVSPVLTGSFWLALIKETETGVLTADQHRRLENLGFRAGNDGRLMRPGRMSIEDIENMGRILDAPLDVTQPDQLVYLKNGNALEPAVPLEIQAGIRWYWKTHPQHLLTEIQAALGQREDELSTELLNIMSSQRIENRTRLRRWVADALSGEVSPVTEPILGLGLQKAGQAYGDLSQWPEELKQWHQRLAEERGEDTVQVDDMATTNVIADNLMPDYRPSVGTRVQWSQDGETRSGVIIEHDKESRDDLWVTSGRPRVLDGGIVFPDRQRIAVDDILGFSRPQPKSIQALEESVTTTEHPVSQTIVNPIDPERLKPQARVTVQHLDRAYQFASKGIEFSAKELIILEMAALTHGLQGHSPLLPNHSSNPMVEHWFGATRAMFAQKEGPSYDDTEREATVVVRDLLLEQFNDAQPLTIDGNRSPLAVYPVPPPGIRMVHYMEDDDLTTDILDRLRNTQFCVAGIHPDYMPVVRDAMSLSITNMDDWLKEKGITNYKQMASDIGRNAFEMISSGQVNTPTEATLGTERAVIGMAERAVTKLTDNRQLSFRQRLDLVDANKDLICEQTGHRLFSSYEAAREWMRQENARFAEVAKKNDRILAAVGELTNTSSSELNDTPHPVLAAVTELQKLNVLPATSKGQALALMNIDLSTQVAWLGEIAEMNGARLALAHSQTLMKEAQYGQSGDLIPSITRRLIATTTTTGWLEMDGVTRPFQVTFSAANKNLNEDTTQRLTALGQSEQRGIVGAQELGKNSRETETLFSQDDGLRMEHTVSLGRIIDLYANTNLALGEPIRPDAISDVDLDNLPVNLYTMDHLGLLQDHLNAPKRHAISDIEMQRYARVPGEGVGDIPGDTLNQHILIQRSALLTMTPSWRNDQSAKDQIREAIQLWVDDQKHLKNLARPERFVDDIYKLLTNHSDAEMIVVGTKSSGRRIRWISEQVTRDSVMNANNDRELAAERGVLAIKASNRDTMKGWQFSAFDAATVLRPQALRLLNERRDQMRREKLGNSEDESRPEKVSRGKRQDRGVVAGLSIKDLRGKSSTILSNLKQASLTDQGKFITKTKLWDSPDWVSLRNPSEDDLNNGERALEPIVAAFIDQLRKDLPAAPPANVPEVSHVYAKMILDIRDTLNEVRTEAELKEKIDGDGELNAVIDDAKSKFQAMDLPAVLLLGEASNWGPPSSCWWSYAKRKSRNNTEWTVGNSTGRKGRITQADETGAMPMLKELKREGGEDYRAGTDIDEQTLLSTFGFSGIEYGKSMTQADRTAYLNQAYDGFMDMAKALKVSPQALSLGGTLGLAFGSRGRGGRNAALAHFEPTNNVINLTRMKGAGSMAHEYGHALANYFYRLSRGTPGDRSSGDITEIIARQLERGARNGEVNLQTGNLRNPVAEAIGSIMQAIQYALPETGDNALPSLNEGAKYRYWGSEMVKGAALADGSRGKPYWKTPEELFARSFETWTHETLKNQFEGFRNDFLVRPDKLESWGTSIEQQPDDAPKRAQLYPSGRQLTLLDKAFAQLVDTLKEKDIEINHEHLGKINLPILYSHDTQGIEVLSQSEHDTLALCVMDEVARMCGERVWLQWQGNLKDGQGNAAAGRYRDLPDTSRDNLERKVLGVIDLAYGARMTTAHHEAFHFAQSHLLTEEEQAVLSRSFAPGADLYNRLVETLRAEGKDDLVGHCDNPREAQAYGYELWVQGKLNIRQEERPATVFGKVRKFFKQVFNVGQDAGFNTSEQIFRAFYRGKLAQRADQRLSDDQRDTQTAQAKPDKPDEATPQSDAESKELNTSNHQSIHKLTAESAQSPAQEAMEDPVDDLEQEASNGPFFR